MGQYSAIIMSSLNNSEEVAIIMDAFECITWMQVGHIDTEDWAWAYL